MKLHIMAETGMNRRNFMQRTGGTLLSTLLGKGVPQALAAKMAARPSEVSGYLTVSLLDLNMDADYALLGAEGIIDLLKKLGARPTGLLYGGDEVLVPMTGQQYTKLLTMGDVDHDDGYFEMDNGYSVNYSFGTEPPPADTTPTNLNTLVHQVWDKVRKFRRFSPSPAHYGDLDTLDKYAKKYGLKPPLPQDEITAVGYGSHRPEISHDQVRQPPRNWKEFRKWADKQEELWKQKHDMTMKWLDDDMELRDKRRERLKRGDPQIPIATDREAGMHQPFESRLDRALGLG